MRKLIMSRKQRNGCGEPDIIIFTLVEVEGDLLAKVLIQSGLDGFESTRCLPLDDAEKFRGRKAKSGFTEGWARS